MRNSPLFGFTLIELMVVMTGMALLMGGTVAAYLRFSGNQKITTDTRKLITEINRVKTMASSLQYPNGCNSLKGVNLTSTVMDQTLSGIKVTTLCDPVNIVEPVVKVLSSSSFTAPFDITFLPGSGYLLDGTDVKIDFQDPNTEITTRSIMISAYGLISTQ